MWTTLLILFQFKHGGQSQARKFSQLPTNAAKLLFIASSYCQGQLWFDFTVMLSLVVRLVAHCSSSSHIRASYLVAGDFFFLVKSRFLWVSHTSRLSDTSHMSRRAWWWLADSNGFGFEYDLNWLSNKPQQARAREWVKKTNQIYRNWIFN